MASLRSLAACAVVAWMASWIVGCGGPPEEAAPILPEELFRGVVSEWPVLVAPTERWTTDSCGAGSWAFQRQADVVVSVQRRLTPEDGVRILLEPAPAGGADVLSASWVGETIEPEPGPGSPVSFPIRAAEPGFHRLRLSVPWSEGNPTASVCFARIAYTLGGEEHALVTGERTRERMIADLGTRAVLGSGPVKRSGLLFVGAARRDLGPIAFARRVVLHAALRNRSAGQATFTVTVDGEPVSEVLAPRGRGEIEVPIAAGERRVSLEVEGRPGGYFLWTPRLQVVDDAEPTPVILVTLDTTRRDVLPAYGDSRTQTPHLDDFARQATLYRRAYASAPWTLPSHASMFTGEVPSQHGAGVVERQLRLDRETVADRYRRAGYLTAGFVAGPMCASRFGLAQGFHQYLDPTGWQSAGSEVLDVVESFLEEFAGERRMFLFVNLFEPHALYEAPEPHRSRQGVPALEAEVEDEPGMADLIAKQDGAWQNVVYGRVSLSPDALRYLGAAYRAEVDTVDEHVGRLFDLLEEHGLYDRALIVVTSDHGELLGEGGHYSHGVRLDPELLEVPLLVKRPGQRSAEVDDRLVSHVDLFRLLSEPLGLEEDGGDGEHAVVLSEEHASLAHPLIPHGKIADHLYSLQWPERRAVVWAGGAECQEAAEGAWRAAPCEQAWETLLAEAIELAGRDVGQLLGAPTGTDVLTEEERSRLEALGYL